MITEAILGAVLVLFGWVDQNPSAARVISLSAHLVNTFLLISAQTSVVFFSSRDRVVSTAAWIRLRSYLIFGFVLLCISGIAGVVAALANMLHPSGSLAAGLQADFASDSPLLVRLRILHPIFSLIGVGYLVWLTKYATSGACASQLYGRGRLVRAVAVGQIGLGVITLAIGGLVPLKLLHLLVADLLMIAFAAFCADVLTADSSETALALDSAA